MYQEYHVQDPKEIKWEERFAYPRLYIWSGIKGMGIGLFLLFFSQLVVGFEDNLGWEMGIVAPLQDL